MSATPTTTWCKPAQSPEPLAHTRSQLLVITSLLEQTLKVVRNVEAEGCDEGAMLQDLISRGEAAITTVLLESQSHG